MSDNKKLHPAPNGLPLDRYSIKCRANIITVHRSNQSGYFSTPTSKARHHNKDRYYEADVVFCSKLKAHHYDKFNE